MKYALQLVPAFIVCLLLLPACVNAEPDGQSDAACVVSGCSGQLCVPAGGPPLASTCQWDPAYACYQHFGECTLQTNGKCGWSETAELLHCIEDADQYSEGAAQH